MHLDILRVRNFGHFEAEASFELGPDARFAVVYGPNGAGKTTLLNGLRGALFGFPRANARQPSYLSEEPDAPPALLSARFIGRDGSRLEVTRTKSERAGTTFRASRTAVGATADTVIDEETFGACVGLRDRHLYESVFGFTLHDLESGSDVLARASFDQLLSGGSLGKNGALRVRTLTESLAAARDRLWKPNGRSREVNVGVRAYDAAHKALGETQVSKAAFERLDAGRRKADGRLHVLTKEVAGLRTRADALVLLRDAWPHWNKARGLRVRLAADVPDDADRGIDSAEEAGRILAVLDEADQRAARERELDDELQRLRRRVAELTPDLAVLDARTAIERLADAAPEMRRLRDTMPGRRERLREDRVRHLGRCAALFRASPSGGLPTEPTEDGGPETDEDPAESEARLDTLADGIPWDAALNDLLTYERAWDAYAADVRRLEQENERATVERDRLRASLGPDTPEVLPPELEALLPKLDAAKERLRADELLARRVREARDEMGVFRSRMRPPLPDAVPPETVALPSSESVRDLLERRRSLASVRDAARRHLAECESGAAEAQSRVESLLRERTIPSASDLAAARAARDDAFSAWTAIRAADRTDVSTEAHEAAAARCRTLVDAADACADALLRDAAAAADLRQRRHELDAATARRDAARLHAADADAELVSWGASWRAFWVGYGVAGVGDGDGAAVMAEWREEAARLRDLAREIARSEQERAAHREALAPLVDALADGTAGPAGAAAVDPARDLERRIAALERRATHAREAAVRRDAARESLAVLDRTMTERARQAAEFREVADETESEKRALLLSAGFAPGLTFAEAVKVFRAGLELARSVDGWREMAGTLAEEEARLDAFGRDAARLVETLGADPTSTVPLSFEDAVLALAGRVRAADQTRAARQVAERACGDKEPQLSAARAHARRSKEALDACLARTGAPDAGALRTRAEAARERFTLRDEAAGLERMARRLLRDDEGLWAELTVATSPERWQSDLEEAEARVRSAEEERTALLREQGARDDEFRRIGGDAAAAAAARREEARALVQETADRYLVHYLAHRILEEVAERYARENQPELLQEASALVRAITDGAYTEVLRSADEKELALLPRNGGVPRAAARLSTGEKEQLYLALRLAYVARHCHHAEPLPVALDDVLVNFDEDRAASTLRALAELSRTTQVLFFTCHRDLRDLATAIVPGAVVANVPAPGPAPKI